MAAFQKEPGAVTSRDFSAGGLMGKLKTWIVKSYGSGGPGWYIIDDQSGIATDPYIVVSNVSSPNWYDNAKIIKITMSSVSEFCQMTYYHWWDVSTQTGYGIWHIGNLVTVTGSFAYDFRGGPECLFISTRVSTTYYTSYIDEWEGVPNFIEDSTKTGISTTPYYKFTGNGAGSGWIRNLYSAVIPRNKVDANRKLYINLVNISGNIYRLEVYNNSLRTAPYLVSQSGSWGSAQNGTELSVFCSQQNSSGVSFYVFMAGTLSGSVSTIELELFKIDLGSGEGANFTAGNYYFSFYNPIYTQYFKVESVSGDSIIVANDIIQPSQSYEGAFSSTYGSGTGMRISPCPKRFYAESSHYNSLSNNYCATYPTHDYIGSEYPYRVTTSPTQMGFGLLSVTNGMAPNEKGKYMMTRGIVYGNSGPNKRYLGKTKNMIFSSNNGLSPFLDGRTLNGNNWLCFNNVSLARLFRDWTSLS